MGPHRGCTGGTSRVYARTFPTSIVPWLASMGPTKDGRPWEAGCTKHRPGPDACWGQVRHRQAFTVQVDGRSSPRTPLDHRSPHAWGTASTPGAVGHTGARVPGPSAAGGTWTHVHAC